MLNLHRNVAVILKGSLPYLLSGIVNGLAPFLVSLLVSRYLGKDALGIFSICFALVFGGILVSDFGLNSLVLRDFAGAQTPTRINLRTLLVVRFSVAVITGLCVFPVTKLFVAHGEFLILASSASTLIVLRSFAGTLENVVKARLQRSTFAAVAIAGSGAHVALVYLVLRSGYGLDRVFLTMTGVEAGKALLLLWVNRRDLGPRFDRSSVAVQPLLVLLRQGMPFALIGFFTLINERSALFFLSRFWGNGEAGIYSAADRFLIIGTLIDSSLFASAFPLLSLFRTDPHFHRITRQTLSITLVLGILGALILFWGAPLLISYSFRFTDSVRLLRILSLSLPALLWNSVTRIALFSLHREQRVAAVFGAAGVLNIILNLVVVPRFASTGAAVVSVVTEYCIAAAYGLLYLRRAAQDIVLAKQEIGNTMSHTVDDLIEAER